MSNCLIIFTRYPVPGKAKTRLIPALTAVGAADLHRQMTEHTLAQVRQFDAEDPISIEIHYAGDQDDNKMADWLGADLVYQVQVGEDLGQRMSHSLRSVFASGRKEQPSAIIIGTDCPGLNADLLKLAFDHLRTHDLAIGPAIDGGYYLMGLSRFIPELFVGVEWSTAQVLNQTVEIANKLGLSIAYLPTLADIDRPEDLLVWEQLKASANG